ncbi:hypothetical protein ACA910_009520 [Epithemia clementina (nom. ined.)]
MAVEFLAAPGNFLCFALGRTLLDCVVAQRRGICVEFTGLLLVGILDWDCVTVRRGDSILVFSIARASVWTLPGRLISAAPSLPVFVTHLVSLTTMCAIVSVLMMTASALQLSLSTPQEWSTVRSRIQMSLRY